MPLTTPSSVPCTCGAIYIDARGRLTPTPEHADRYRPALPDAPTRRVPRLTADEATAVLAHAAYAAVLA